jgi:hypothetical protein
LIYFGDIRQVDVTIWMALVCFIQVLEVVLANFGAVSIINLQVFMIFQIWHILVMLWITPTEEVS